MTEAERALLTQALQTMQEQLRAHAETSAQSTETVQLDQSAVGRVSRVEALQQQQMALQLEQRRQLQLQQIDGAFLRMANGHYGACFVCGEEIAFARLQMNPLLTRCVHCAEN